MNVKDVLDHLGIKYDSYTGVTGYTGYNIELENGWITIRDGVIVDLSYVNLNTNESRHHTVDDLEELRDYIKLYNTGGL